MLPILFTSSATGLQCFVQLQRITFFDQRPSGNYYYRYCKWKLNKSNLMWITTKSFFLRIYLPTKRTFTKTRTRIWNLAVPLNETAKSSRLLDTSWCCLAITCTLSKKVQDDYWRGVDFINTNCGWSGSQK